MATLHIEHAISDFPAWKLAFDRFAAKRLEAGVISHRIHQPLDDPAYIVVQLDFQTQEQASAFLSFLETKVWPSPANAPALVGTPRARLLIEPPGV